jgi:hypothetical protein
LRAEDKIFSKDVKIILKRRNSVWGVFQKLDVWLGMEEKGTV